MTRPVFSVAHSIATAAQTWECFLRVELIGSRVMIGRGGGGGQSCSCALVVIVGERSIIVLMHQRIAITAAAASLRGLQLLLLRGWCLDNWGHIAATDIFQLFTWLSRGLYLLLLSLCALHFLISSLPYR